ncbi:MAG: flagellar hook-length control protein FliK [Desulfitobacteriaceae bacterium]
MTGLDVLSSTGLKGATSTDLSSSETDSSDDSLSADFAAILGGWMFTIAGAKGQDSGEQKSGDQTRQSSQASLGNMTVSNAHGIQELGLQKVLAGFLELSQEEPILQRDFPAGKEANSGGIVSQGNEIFNSLLNVGGINFGPLESAMDLQRTGMTLQKSTSDINPTVSELDKNKIIISKLLQELSGEVQVLTSTQDKLALALKERWPELNTQKFTEQNTDEVNKPTNLQLNADEVNKPTNLQLNADEVNKPTNLQLNADEVNKPTNLQLNADEVNKPTNLQLTADQVNKPTNLQSNTDQVNKPTNLQSKFNTMAISNDLKTLNPHNNSFDKAETNANLAQFASLSSKKEVPQVVLKTEDFVHNPEDLPKSTYFVVSDKQQGSPAGDDSTKGSFISTGNNIEKGSILANSQDEAVKHGDIMKTDNKIDGANFSTIISQGKVEVDNVALTAGAVKAPLWEQIATAIQQHPVTQRQEIRGFEIQLHPEDLGKIQVTLRWENGQVHVQCQASEAVTVGILQQNLAQLRESLLDNGVSCGMMQMGLGGQQQQQKPKDELKSYSQAGEPEAEEKNRLVQAVSYSTGKLSDGHLINLTA